MALEDSVPGATAAMASGVITVGVPHKVPLPDDARMILWETLSGRTSADLAQLVTDRHLQSVPTPTGNTLEGAYK